MKNPKRSIFKGSILASAIIATSGLSTEASSGLFNYNSLGSGEEVRTTLLDNEESSKNFELKCGGKGKSDTTKEKKGKDGKCGEGNKKKGNEGKCGEGKCGGNKNSQK